MKQLKLYVWEEVLNDYTAGVMFALAESEEQAKAAIIEKHKALMKFDLEPSYFEGAPRVVESPEGFFLYGGG